MQLSRNTILITGGTSGIGLGLAKALCRAGNTVIVTGRGLDQLDAARAQVPGLRAIQSDASDPQAIVKLHDQVVSEFPGLNVLINNAGIMRKLNLHDERNLEDLTREIRVNLDGPIWMVAQFLPHLKKQKKATIVNVTSGIAFVPFAISPIYSAAKAGLRAYTCSLRLQLKNTRVSVVELAPPSTDTALLRGEFTAADAGGLTPMAPDKLVEHAMTGLKRGTLEIRPGMSNLLKVGSRVAPDFMLKQLGKSVDLMLK